MTTSLLQRLELRALWSRLRASLTRSMDMPTLPNAPNPVPYDNPRELTGMKVVAFDSLFIEDALREIAAWVEHGDGTAPHYVESVTVDFEDGVFELIVTYSIQGWADE